MSEFVCLFACVCAYVPVCLSVFECVCAGVCVFVKDRERERQREEQGERKTEIVCLCVCGVGLFACTLIQTLLSNLRISQSSGEYRALLMIIGLFQWNTGLFTTVCSRCISQTLAGRQQVKRHWQGGSDCKVLYMHAGLLL